MGRKKLWSEDMQARFREGTFERIASVLKDTEDRTEFVRAAVENELARRESLAGVRRKQAPGMKARKAPRAGNKSRHK